MYNKDYNMLQYTITSASSSIFSSSGGSTNSSSVLEYYVSINNYEQFLVNVLHIILNTTREF